jgi:uncharacterized protein (TIGR00369 family)
MSGGEAQGFLPEHLKIEWEEVRSGYARNAFTAARLHMAPNGFLHAGSVVTLADSASGFGCMASLPQGGQSFTTIELKTNFLGTAREGERVVCEARLAHGGRTTQVWDAEVRNATTGKAMALFRCTQMILYPR